MNFTKMVKEKQTRTYDLDGFRKRAACLCVKDATEYEILLVTSSRMTDHWIVPGGGVEPNEDPSEAAIRETEEEAGVRGSIKRCLGDFEVRDQAMERKHRTSVFVLEVTEELPDWEDARCRHRRWFPVEDALRLLANHKPVQCTYISLLIQTSPSLRHAAPHLLTFDPTTHCKATSFNSPHPTPSPRGDPTSSSCQSITSPSPCSSSLYADTSVCSAATIPTAAPTVVASPKGYLQVSHFPSGKNCPGHKKNGNNGNNGGAGGGGGCGGDTSSSPPTIRTFICSRDVYSIDSETGPEDGALEEMSGVGSASPSESNAPKSAATEQLLPSVNS